MEFKIIIKETKLENGQIIGSFQMNKKLGENHYEALVLCSLNQQCLEKLKCLNDFEFEFAEELLKEQRMKTTTRGTE